MSKRKSNPAKDPQFAREEQRNLGAEHIDPRTVRNPNGGVDDANQSTFAKHGGLRPDKGTDKSTVDVLNKATTSDGGLALDGGKLSGNRDDFEGDLSKRGQPTPGADPSNQVTPAHDLETGDTGKTNNPD